MVRAIALDKDIIFFSQRVIDILQITHNQSLETPESKLEYIMLI